MSHLPRAVLAVLTVATLFTGCATTGGAACAEPGEFKPMGEISSASGGASWDATRVQGPKINVSRRCDGSWAGNIGDNVIDVSVYPNRLAGSGLTATWTREGDKTVITGQVHGQIVRYELDNKQLLVRTPTTSMTLARSAPERYGDITLKGEAIAAVPPEPQLVLGLVGAFF